MKLLIFAACASALALGACQPDEIDAPGEESKLGAVKEDAQDLAHSTGEAMKEGLDELKEGVQDAGEMAKVAGAELKEAGGEIKQAAKDKTKD